MNKVRTEKITDFNSLSELFFFIGWGIYLTQAVLAGSTLSIRIGYDELSSIYQGLRYISYFLFALSLFNQMVSDSFLKVFIVIMVASSVITYATGNSTLVFLFFVILAGYKQDYKKVLKFTFILHLSLFLLIVLSSQIGIIPDYISDILTRERHCLGFTWASLPQTYILFLTMEYICLREKNIKYSELIFLLVPCTVIFILTNARMTYLINILFIGLVFLYKLSGMNHSISQEAQRILILLPIVLCLLALSMYFMYNPDKTLWQKMDSFLSGRLKLGSDALKQYGVSLFGTKNLKFRGHSVNSISQDQSLYNYVDCSYLQTLLLYGIVGLGTIITMFTYFLRKALKARNTYLVLSILCLLLLCITEDSLLIIRFDIFLILIFSDISEEHQINDIE